MQNFSLKENLISGVKVSVFGWPGCIRLWLCGIGTRPVLQNKMGNAEQCVFDHTS